MPRRVALEAGPAGFEHDAAVRDGQKATGTKPIQPGAEARWWRVVGGLGMTFHAIIFIWRCRHAGVMYLAANRAEILARQ